MLRKDDKRATRGSIRHFARSRRVISVLTIAGSDSGGGAGIQADLKSFAALRVHGLSAITAITAQNTRAVTAVQLVKTAVIDAQIDALYADFAIGAVKIGMLGDARISRAVAGALTRHRAQNIVLDPVMIASSGARLLSENAISVLRATLIPLATVITPNLPEAELLLNRRIAGARAMPAAARDLLALGPRAVLLKGGHLARGGIEDHYVDRDTHLVMHHARLRVSGHGTGCTLASAVAAYLARGELPLNAARRAVSYLQRALLTGYRPGRGAVTVADHFDAGLHTR
jgi:hydroxymethylpyrimidine/phosphomethylpyrimidine kinase